MTSDSELEREYPVGANGGNGCNPKWVECHRNMGRRPKPWEFILWNSNRIREWVRELGLAGIGGHYLYSAERHAAYDQWLKANAGRAGWKTV